MYDYCLNSFSVMYLFYQLDLKFQRTKTIEINTYSTQHPPVQITSSVAHTEPASDNLGPYVWQVYSLHEEKRYFIVMNEVI
jgi:hypothetical protein